MSALRNIIVVVLCGLLTSAIILPSLLKFSHFFIERSHVECHEHIKTHFHQTDLDCKLFKFHHANQINFVPEEITFETIILPSKQNFEHYLFINSYQKLHFALRAPPLA